MAAFTISYRLPSGGLKSEVIDAADRASALAQMKARGITPVSVKEGGTIAAAAKVAAKQPAWIKGAIAGLVVVIAAVIAFFCLMPTEKPAAPKVEKPKKVKVEKPRSSKAKVRELSPAECLAPVEGDGKRDRRVTVEDAANSQDGTIVKPRIAVDPYTNRTFKTGTEQLISWVFTTEVGEMPMPIPTMDDDERMRIWEILTSKNEIKPGDSDKTIDSKQTVDAVKKEMLKYVKEGGDPKDFLNHYYKVLKTSFEIREEALRQAEELQEKAPSEVDAFVKKINAELQEQGIKGIELEKDDWVDGNVGI